MNILFLCRRKDLKLTQRGFARAFEQRGVSSLCVDECVPLNVDLRRILARCPAQPSVILQPESELLLMPWGLAEVDVPTVCFQIDTYAYTRPRIRWSMLFDHPIVFHPGYEEKFRTAGHPGVFTVFHAVERDVFDKPEETRILDVGFVGKMFASFQQSRQRVLVDLSRCFQMNDWRRFYSYEEMAQVYRCSKVVVNVARDDFPQDANMRAFEAMAAGALLITRVPSELTQIGFKEGTHFIGYEDERTIVDLVGQYQANERARRRIAEAAREKVFREHTYDCRVDALLQMLEENAGKLCAPARGWSEERIRLTYLDFYSAHFLMGCAHHELRCIASRSFRSATAGAYFIARARAIQSRGWLMARLPGVQSRASAGIS